MSKTSHCSTVVSSTVVNDFSITLFLKYMRKSFTIERVPIVGKFIAYLMRIYVCLFPTR